MDAKEIVVGGDVLELKDADARDLLGSETLDTEATTVTGAINELNSKVVKYKKLTFQNLSNSGSGSFYLQLTDNLKSLLGETDLDIVSATIYAASGFGALVGIETTESTTYLNFNKGTTFSNAHISIMYAYVPK